jgi:cell division protein FtsW
VISLATEQGALRNERIRIPTKRPRTARRDTGRTGRVGKSSTAKSHIGRTVASRKAITGNEAAYLVLIPTVALLLLGLVMVFSAGSVVGISQGMSGYRLFVQQGIWALLGFSLMVLFTKIDYHKIGKVSWLGVLVSIGLLVLVLFSGRAAGGARRWLMIGPFNLQPTEIAKFTLVVFAAYALAIKGQNIRRFVHLIVPVLLVVGLGAGLILMQPDMGSALVLCLSVGLVLILSRAKLSHLALIGTSGGVAALYFMMSASYRRARIFSFLNPWSTPRGSGYQVIQSYIALGSGHIMGLGLGMSRQKFLYLPNAHTDFIFAVIGEELGMAGTLMVVILVALLAIGGLKIAKRAPDEMGKLMAAGITGLIVVQALVNMGGVTGLLPITGVPLPLVSFGGSSLCVCMGCIGILLNIAAQGRH